MTIRSTRRQVLGSSLLLATGALPFGRLLAQAGASPAAAANLPDPQGPLERLMALEREHGGRLGVAMLDALGGRRINHRGEQRFPMCSTFKWLAAALVLQRVDRGEERLERRVVFERDDLVPWSPGTEHRTGAPGMTLAELCEAAITLSDNTAGNLLLASFGGPPALTAFARSLGDSSTRLDRIEPELNEARPGDPRDTTTPAGMLTSMRAALVGDALSAASRERLVGWLLANTTGAARLRAGFPDDWRVGDKTGTSGTGVSNDVAIAWPPRRDDREPVLVAAYYDGTGLAEDHGDTVLAEVGRIVADAAKPPLQTPSAT